MGEHQPLLKRWLRLLAAKGVQELVLVNRRAHGNWWLPHATRLKGVSFPSLRELGICSVLVEDGDIDSLVVRCPVLEILNIQGSTKRLHLVSQTLRCVQISSSVVENIALVKTPCLERLILWQVKGSPFPASDMRTRIKIGIAPKLRVLGYLDPAHHLLEIGGTRITAGMEPTGSAILTTVKVLSLEVCLGANGAMMVPAFLKCFPNVEALQIKSAKCDEPAGKFNIEYWQKVGPIISVLMRIKVMTISEFRGEQHELAFLQFVYQNAQVLESAVVTAANRRFTGISDEQMTSILQKLDSSRWASDFGLAIMGSNGPEGGIPWMFQRGANFSNDDPFAPKRVY
nr:unnamed protein product [Digitaria exilis]